MDAKAIREYPYLDAFLRGLGDRVARNPTVQKAFRDASTVVDAVADQALVFGNDPGVLPGDIGARYGRYDPAKARTVIFIDQGFEQMLANCRDFKGVSWVQNGEVRHQFNAQPAAEMLIEAKVLHEIVHFLDYTADNQHLDTEAGNLFERAAYGKVLKHWHPDFALVEKVFPSYFRDKPRK
ncbi:hypothetical protein [Aliiruegeria lutimaris]|nr:hypothetical protein [Aliiruegeria lutimaris]